MPTMNVVQYLAVAALPTLFAITVHEVAHGWMARRLGDPTAMMLGRLTLNPVKHIDPIGTVLLPIFLVIANTGFIFGWAKPVPVSGRNLRNPRRDMALVAAAGPLANLLMALIWGFAAWLAIKVHSDSTHWFAQPLALMGEIGIRINVVLMVLNLLPVPPLDGSRVVSSMLPGPLSYKYDRLEVYGLVILVVLMALQVLGAIVGPPVAFTEQLIYSLFDL